MTETQPIDFDSLWDYNDPSATEAKFHDLLPAAKAGGDASYLAELLTQIARTQSLQQHFDDAHRTLDEVEPMLVDASSRARVRYLLERGRTFNSSRHREDARPLFLEAWELACKAGEDFHAVDAAHMVAIAESTEGSLEWNERAIAYAEQSADPRARAWLGSLYNNLGWTYHDLGRYQDALATFERGLAWQQDAGKPAEARIASWTVARTLRSLGRYEDALARQRDNLRALEAAGVPDGYAHEEIGECLLALGREDEARPHFARAYAVLRGDPWLQRDEPQRLQRLATLGEVER